MWNVERVTKFIQEKNMDEVSAKLSSKHKCNVVGRARVRVGI